jgi:HSP20 family molecular chaperone IbpA
MSSEITTREPESVDERPFVRPPVDIFENQDEFLVIADLPGVAKDDLVVHLDADRLSIEGAIGKEPGTDPLEREFQLLRYRRTFELPNTIDRERVSAELERGVLRLHLPKVEAVKPRRIAIRAS